MRGHTHEGSGLAIRHGLMFGHAGVHGSPIIFYVPLWLLFSLYYALAHHRLVPDAGRQRIIPALHTEKRIRPSDLGFVVTCNSTAFYSVVFA